MSIRELLALARRHHVNVRLDENGVVMVDSDEEVDDDEYDRVIKLLRPARDGIRAYLHEFRRSSSASEAVIAAQGLLREGIAAKCPPAECGFHIGSPGGDCRRCGVSWAEHSEGHRRQNAT